MKKDKDHPYTMINNQHVLYNPRLSLKAKALLAIMLSKPDDWQFYEKDLTKYSTDGISATRSAMKELIDQGYVIRHRQRDSKGRLQANIYFVSEMPKSPTESSYVRFSNIGESHPTNTDLTNTNAFSCQFPHTWYDNNSLRRAEYDSALHHNTE